MHSLGWHLQQGWGRINNILHQNKLCQINNVQGNLFRSLAINYITQHHFTFFCGKEQLSFVVCDSPSDADMMLVREGIPTGAPEPHNKCLVRLT